MQQDMVEFSNAVLGTIDLMGKEILVRLRSPLMIFLPMSLIISLPVERTFLICISSAQIFPPLEYACSCRCSS